MKLIGKVISIHSATKNSKKSPIRPKVEQLNCIKDFGIENDKFAGDDLNKSVMVVGTFSYETAKKSKIDLEYGSLGENIVFDFNPHDYKTGTVFYMGEASIQICERCTICSHLGVFDHKLPEVVEKCRGLYCKVLSNGIIKEDTEVFIKE